MRVLLCPRGRGRGCWGSVGWGAASKPHMPFCIAGLPVSGVQVCNHRFHGECIKHWGDTSCPVCRYCMLSSNANTSRCSTCGANTNLWICLICGHVGCGRWVQGWV